MSSSEDESRPSSVENGTQEERVGQCMSCCHQDKVLVEGTRYCSVCLMGIRMGGLRYTCDGSVNLWYHSYLGPVNWANMRKGGKNLIFLAVAKNLADFDVHGVKFLSLSQNSSTQSQNWGLTFNTL